MKILLSEEQARTFLRRWDWQFHICAMVTVWCIAFLVWDVIKDYPLFAIAQILLIAINASSARSAWRHRKYWKGFINYHWSKKNAAV